MENNNTYIIRGGDYGQERLHILSTALESTTKYFLLSAGLEKGMKVLDIGCGNGSVSLLMAGIVGESGQVTGIDMDEKIIEYARANSNNLTNLEFLAMNINSGTNLDNDYDFIYMRFILSHLKNPLDLIEFAKSHLKDGGIIAVEDVDFTGHFCYPESEAFDKYVEWYTKTAISKSVDAYIGKKLVNLFQKAELQDIEFSVINPAFHTGVGKLISVLTLNNIAVSVIESGIASESEVKRIVDELEKFTFSHETIISMTRIMQAAGKLLKN
jgi:2-polyprenyl-3-methyl-5-hydroxy-6-metoxy-1,4-benzoquinol methylase